MNYICPISFIMKKKCIKLQETYLSLPAALFKYTDKCLFWKLESYYQFEESDFPNLVLTH